MERDLPMDDGRIVHRELSDELGTEISSPTDVLGGLLQQAITNRDAGALKSLVIDQYPTVVWGKYFNQLSDEDSAWAMEAVQT